VDVQYPWEDSRAAIIGSGWTSSRSGYDRYPVTNARFKEFIDAIGYHPRDGATS